MAEERVRTNALDDGPYVVKEPMVVVDTFRAERAVGEEEDQGG